MPGNCVYNEEHHPVPLHTPSSDGTELDVAPRRSKTLIVMQPDAPVRLCMYGSDDASTWAGVVCDNESVARRCPKFKPKVTVSEATAKAESLLADDDWVFEHMKDVAALQWVIGDRIYKHEPTTLQRIQRWLIRRFTKVAPALPPPEDTVDLPSDIWDDSDDSSFDSRA